MLIQKTSIGIVRDVTTKVLAKINMKVSITSKVTRKSVLPKGAPIPIPILILLTTPIPHLRIG